MFLDEVTIDAQGGKGGKGCVAWRRDKLVRWGGPFGGDGGDGGSVILQADPNTDTLSDFQSRKRFEAKPGEQGGGQNKAGHSGEDLVLLVPPGTVVSVIGDKSTEMIGDLLLPGDRVVVARGGRGGYGNAHFKTATRQTPDFAELGEPGEKQTVKLELKLVADVGIIGYPSVGKSSLIAAVSSAKPKIAEYHFTTLVPNLGVVKVADREFVLCDVPGLIEGASEGKGLGDAFLRHIERCGILIHLLDIGSDDMVADYKAIRKELKAYSPALAKKKELVVINKIDLVGGDDADWVKQLKKAKIPVFASISAAARLGTKELMKKLLPVVIEERKTRELPDESERKPFMPVLRPHLLSSRMGAYRVDRSGDKVVITGKRLEQFTSMTDFGKIEAKKRFIDVIERIGLVKAINAERRKGATEIFIGETDIVPYL